MAHLNYIKYNSVDYQFILNEIRLFWEQNLIGNYHFDVLLDIVVYFVRFDDSRMRLYNDFVYVFEQFADSLFHGVWDF
jgi:hypothetical protein